MTPEKCKGVCLLLALALAAGTACMRRGIHEQDRPLLVTLRDLEPYGFKLGHLSHREKLSRTVYLDGSMEIEYEFETPDSEAKGIFLSSTATYERSEADAKATFRLEKGGAAIGARIGGAKIREARGFFQWGDESHFAYLDGKDGPGGIYFSARLGSKCYSLVLAGLYFSDAKEWESLILPKLEYLRNYDPE